MGVRNTISLKYAFKITLLQLGLLKVVTWPGSWFLEKRFLRLKIYRCPPILRDVLQPYVQLIQHECSSLKRIL